jgi:hypothetical protein
VDVGFDRLEQLGFEQQLAQVEPLDCIALQDLDDRRREVRADVTEPPDDAGFRASEATGPTGRPASAAI